MARSDSVERVWQAFLAQRGLTDDSPIDDPEGFYASWEEFLLNSREMPGRLPGAAPPAPPIDTTARPGSVNNPIVRPRGGNL